MADYLATALGCSTDWQCEHVAMLFDWGLDLIEACWVAGVAVACWCYLRHLARRFLEIVN
jgi:hypothetical protein